MPSQVLTNLTTITPAIFEPLELTLRWLSAAGSQPSLSLDLTFALGPSFAQGAKQTTLLGVSGKLSVVGSSGREDWDVTQENFRRFSPYADYSPSTGKVVFSLPVAFQRSKPTPTDPLHALLLIPCRLQGAKLACSSPRAAFEELVRQLFPAQPKLERVLPFRWQALEQVSPAP